jgi:hypothetical protein
MSGRREILWEYGTFELITLESHGKQQPLCLGCVPHNG